VPLIVMSMRPVGAWDTFGVVAAMIAKGA